MTSLTVITDMALVIESAKIVLLSVKSAKVTEFCITKTIYTPKSVPYVPSGRISQTHVGSGHAATSTIGAVS